MVMRVCPACGGSVELVHRKPLDRLVNVFYKVHRYECLSPGCGWDGVLSSAHRRGAKGRKRMKSWMWLAVIVISIAAAFAMVVYLDSRPAAGTSVEGPP